MIEPHLNILIGGAPRTGKSLLAASLFKALGSPVIHGDTLVNAMKNNYPGAFGVEFDALSPEDYAAHMDPLQLFLKKVIRNMGKDISYRAKVFESCYLHPRAAAALAREGPVISIFLVYGDFDVAIRIKDVRTYAEINQHCWSHKHDDESLGHTGGINGFAANLTNFPNQNLTIAVLCNVEAANSTRISRDLAAIVFGEPYERPTLPDVVTVDPSVYERYVGIYQVAPEFQVSITIEADQLQIQATGQPPLTLYPSSETEFFARVMDLRIVFKQATDGAVESLILFQYDREIVAPKVD